MCCSKVTAILIYTVPKVGHFVTLVSMHKGLLAFHDGSNSIHVCVKHNGVLNATSLAVAGPVLRFHVTSVSMRKRAMCIFYESDGK